MTYYNVSPQTDNEVCAVPLFPDSDFNEEAKEQQTTLNVFKRPRSSLYLLYVSTLDTSAVFNYQFTWYIVNTLEHNQFNKH